MRLPALILAAMAAAILASPVYAEPPTLGATISPAAGIFEDTPYVRIDSRATVPVLVVLEASGGYVLAETNLRMEPGAKVTVPYTAAGDGSGDVTATMRAAEAQPGMDQTTLVLGTTVRHLTAMERFEREYGPVLPIGLLLALGAIVLVLGARRRRRTHREG